MVSELSRSIATRMLVAKAQGSFDQEYSSAMELIRPKIDAELQEVREVLFHLQYNRLGDGPCWCDDTDGAGPGHDEPCQRARELMKRLEVK